jgi:hypothetical protein
MAFDALHTVPSFRISSFLQWTLSFQILNHRSNQPPFQNFESSRDRRRFQHLPSNFQRNTHQGGGPKPKGIRRNCCGTRSKLLPPSHSLQELSRIHPQTRMAFSDAGRGCHIEVLVGIGIGCQCEPFIDQGHQ